MKGNKKVAKNKGVPNERRRLSLRPRTTPIAKTPVIPEGSKKSKNSKKSTQEREPSHISLSVTDESEREGSESERSKKSTPEREPSYQSRSISDESEREGSESEEEMQPPQPLELYFKSSEFTKICKIQTKCYVSATVKVIKETLKKDQAEWFTSHSQFRHFFHMPEEPNLKLQGMWMLLLHTICTPEDDVAWFAVNGVPIRYSMREHALISGLDCTEYPRKYKKIGGHEFVNYYFHDIEKITITDVKQKLLSMPDCPDKLKMAVLFFLGTVIRGKPRYEGNLDSFILRMVDDLDACKTFPWGRLTFEDSIREIKRVMNQLKGEVTKDAVSFPGFIVPLEILAIECILALGKEFRIYQKNPCADCPRMCKSRFTKTSMRGYPLEDIYRALGDTKTIHSVLEPNIGEKMLLARIIDLEREYDRQGSPSETWNHWLTVKQKSIWWEELYDLDQAARVFTKKKDKEKVTFAEASSSDSSLQGLENRLLDFMGEAFVGLNFTVETKLEAVDLRLGGIEKNQRLLRCRAKKIEKRLTSIENKVSEKPNHGEDMDFGQCDGTDFGQWDGKEKDDAEEEEKEKSGKEKEKSGEVDKDKENSETDEENDSERELNELKERCRVQADELWREVEAAEAEEDQANDERKEAATNEESIENSEDDEKVEASESPNSEPRFESPINVPRFESPINEPRVEADKTPTPPSGGRTKAMAARRVVVVEAKEKAIEKAVELEKKTSEEVVEAEEKTSEKAVEAEEKTSEKVVERMDGTKEATRPRIRHRCKEKTMTSGKPTPKRRGRPRRSIADAAPKKSDCTPHASKGRGKRKCEPSQWVQTPFTRGKKPKTKA